MSDRNERLATGDKEDGQDEKEQQEAAVQKSSILGKATEESWTHKGPGEGYSWDEVSIETSGSQARWETFAENRSSGAQWVRDVARVANHISV